MQRKGDVLRKPSTHRRRVLPQLVGCEGVVLLARQLGEERPDPVGPVDSEVDERAADVRYEAPGIERETGSGRLREVGVEAEPLRDADEEEEAAEVRRDRPPPCERRLLGRL